MQNITTTIKGNILTITVDLSKEFGQSKSGKSTIIASSQGNQALAGPNGKTVHLGLNVYSKE